jgi:NCS1 family nucleobase:cation symporter-1
VAIVALLAGALPSLPGFLATVEVVSRASVPAFFLSLYSYAWFVGFALAFAVYLVGRKLSPQS